MKPKHKKIFLVITGILFIGAAVVILCISSATKYLVEKYDEKYTGREIEMGWAYVNPFTGHIYFSDLKLYESKSDSIFFSTKGLSIDIGFLQLLSKTYAISELMLNEPKGIIIQNKKDFNFDDLVEKFLSKKSDTLKNPVRFNILHIKINDGKLYYQEKAIGVNYFIKKVNFESSGMRWNVDTISANFSFLSGAGSGEIIGNGTVNIHTMNYRLAAIANKFDLEILEQYLNDMSNYGSFSANLDADLQATGNLNDKENINAKGIMTINDFHLGKSPNNDYASFDKLVLDIKDLSPKNHIFFFDSVSVKNLFLKYERYDHLDNLQNMFGKNGANIATAASNNEKYNLIIEIARYIKVLVKNFFQSNYKINRIAIYNADLKFNDYSLTEKFSADLYPLYIFADSIDKTRKRVNVSIKSGIKPYGDVSIDLSVNPQDSSDFDMQYRMEKLPFSMFNPYTISYTSFALDKGTMEIKGNWDVKNGIIKSDNHLLLIDPRVTKRIRNKDTKWIPMPLIMSFIRERGNVIDYEIPITGNLKNPKFHLHDVILDLVSNIFIKPPTTQYRIQVKKIETEIEKSHTLKWNIRQHSLEPNQKKFIDHMVDFLVNNLEATIDIYPKEYAIKEKEHISFFEAKKKYFLLYNNKKVSAFNEDDSLQVEKMSVKDSLFVRYLNKQLKDSMLFTIQEKCSKFIGEAIIKSKFIQLNRERKNNLISYFKAKNVTARLKIHASENTIPYNGFSSCKIYYKGSLPESLLHAYQKINEFDEETPRKEYKRERRKNKNTL